MLFIAIKQRRMYYSRNRCFYVKYEDVYVGGFMMALASLLEACPPDSIWTGGF